MFQPKPPDTPGQPQQGRSQKEIRTLTGMVAVFFVFFGAFVLVPMMTPGSDSVAPTTTESSDWEPIDVVMGRQPIQLKPELEKEIGEATEEQRVLKEPKPFLYLLEEVNRRSYRFLASGGFETVSPADLIASPDTNRARRVELKGELIYAEEKALDEGGALPDQVVEGVIKTDAIGPDGQPCFAYFALSGTVPGNVELGDVVRLQGVFFKSYHFDVNPVGSPSFRTGPLIVAKRLMKSYFFQNVTSLDSEVLDTVEDDIAKAKVLEFEPLYHTISYAKHYLESRPRITEETDEEEAKADLPPLIQGKDLRERPADYRGKMIRLIGKLEWLEKEPVDANPAGIDVQYRAIMRSQDRILVETVFLEKPKNISLGNAVEVVGIFFKNHAFLNQSGGTQGQYTWSPYLVGTSIYDAEFKDPLFTELQYMVLIVAVVLAAVFSFVIVRDKKKTREFVEIHRQKRKQARAGTDINKIGREAFRRATEAKSVSAKGEEA